MPNICKEQTEPQINVNLNMKNTIIIQKNQINETFTYLLFRY